MTNTATVPQYCLPIAVPDGGWTFTVEFTGGSPSSNFTAGVLAGAYYMDGAGDLSDLMFLTADALTLNDAGGTWTVVRVNGRLEFARTGQVGDVISSFEFPPASGDDIPSKVYGYTASTYTGAESEILENSTNFRALGDWRPRYCWTPDEILEQDDATPVAEAVGDITPDGGAVVDGLGERARLMQVMRFVPAALVKQTYTDQAAYCAYVSGPAEFGQELTPGDPNAALQVFWTFARVLAGPTPPVIRYAPDRDDPATFKTIIWPEVKFLSDFGMVAKVDQRQPLTYSVTCIGQLTEDSVARPSGSWENDCVDGGGGSALTEYDTFDDAYANGSPGDYFTVDIPANPGFTTAWRYVGQIMGAVGAVDHVFVPDPFGGPGVVPPGKISRTPWSSPLVFVDGANAATWITVTAQDAYVLSPTMPADQGGFSNTIELYFLMSQYRQPLSVQLITGPRLSPSPSGTRTFHATLRARAESNFTAIRSGISVNTTGATRRLENRAWFDGTYLGATTATWNSTATKQRLVASFVVDGSIFRATTHVTDTTGTNNAMEAVQDADTLFVGSAFQRYIRWQMPFTPGIVMQVTNDDITQTFYGVSANGLNENMYVP